MSIPPNVLTASTAIFCASALREMSATTTCALPLCDRISWATRSLDSAFTSAMTTAAPSCANASAVALPIPPPAPVMTATFSSNCIPLLLSSRQFKRIRRQQFSPLRLDQDHPFLADPAEALAVYRWLKHNDHARLDDHRRILDDARLFMVGHAEAVPGMMGIVIS